MDEASELREASARGLRLKTADVLTATATLAAGRLALWYHARRTMLPRSRQAWERAGVEPVPYHYYEPVVPPSVVESPRWREADPLCGIDLRPEAQLELLCEFEPYVDEVRALPWCERPATLDYFYDNPNFGPGDAELLYCMIRRFRPRRVLEVGSGYSTRLVRHALAAGAGDGSSCRHVCIEPYEMPWLEQLGVDRVVRAHVETLDLGEFLALEENDILFLDSSHVARPGGDVQHLYLRVLPVLKPGVIVHIHDVFLPHNYPAYWVATLKRFWNEQCLLQAFLAFNAEFEVLIAAHYLASAHREQLGAACPILAEHLECEPGSFWIRRRY